MEGKIISFQLTSKGAAVQYTDNVLESGENTVKEYKVKINRRISDTFRNQLRTLLGHGLLISSLATSKEIDEKSIKNRKIVDMPQFSKFGVVGFSRKKDGDEEELTLNLELHPELGGCVKIAVPPILLHGEEYEHGKYLVEDFTQILEEVHNYIQGNNYYVQGDLFAEKEEEVPAGSDPDLEF